MSKYIYIFVILYNLNLIINAYIEIMVKNITLFNSKNTTKFSKNTQFFNIILYFYYKNTNFTKIALSTVRENSLTVKLQSSKLSL